MELSTTFFLLYYSPKKRIFQAISFVFEKLRVWILLWKQSGKTGIVWRKKETPSDDREEKREKMRRKERKKRIIHSVFHIVDNNLSFFPQFYLIFSLFRAFFFSGRLAEADGL